MRKFILAVVLLIGVMFIIMNFAEVQAIVETLKRGEILYLVLGLGVLLLWMLNVAASYQAIYRSIGLDETIKNLLPVTAAANFVNIVTPSAGMSGMAVFVAEAHRRNYSSGRAAAAGTLDVLFDYGAFLGVLGLGLIILIRRHDLNAGELVATGILVALALLLIFLVYLGVKSAEALGNVLAWMARQINRLLRLIIHREYLSEKRAREFACDAAEGLREISEAPNKLILPIFLALCKFTLLITILFLCFLAFKVPVSPGTLIAGFSIAYLTLIVSPTPSGIGFVEGALTLSLSSMYIPLSAATVVTLTYRGITFWIPLLLGMIAFRWLGGAKDIKAAL
jgi:uncharacterized protein (TIRG00374 family)